MGFVQVDHDLVEFREEGAHELRVGGHLLDLFRLDAGLDVRVPDQVREALEELVILAEDLVHGGFAVPGGRIVGLDGDSLVVVVHGQGVAVGAGVVVAQDGGQAGRAALFKIGCQGRIDAVGVRVGTLEQQFGAGKAHDFAPAFDAVDLVEGGKGLVDVVFREIDVDQVEVQVGLLGKVGREGLEHRNGQFLTVGVQVEERKVIAVPEIVG